MPAAPPKKSTAKVSLGFGLVSIPAKIYSGAEEGGYKLSEYTHAEDGLHKVGRNCIDKVTGQEIENSAIVKCLETEKGLVELTPDEIEAVLQPTNGVAEIEAFLPLHFLGAGSYIPTGLAQIRPDKGGEQSFSLLMAGMKREQVFGLVRVTARNKVRYSALLPTGRLYPLLFDDEVREELPMPTADHDEGELEMAIRLIQSKTEASPLTLADPSKRLITEYALKKAGANGQAVEIEPAKPKGTNDLMAALKASLEAQQ